MPQLSQAVEVLKYGPFPHSDMIVSHYFRDIVAAFRENRQGWNCISLESAETSRLAGIPACGIDNNQSIGLGCEVALI